MTMFSQLGSRAVHKTSLANSPENEWDFTGCIMVKHKGDMPRGTFKVTMYFYDTCRWIFFWFLCHVAFWSALLP